LELIGSLFQVTSSEIRQFVVWSYRDGGIPAGTEQRQFHIMTVAFQLALNNGNSTSRRWHSSWH
jgi:hypothetical protein